MGMKIVLKGNPNDGFHAIGPFRHREEAEAYIFHAGANGKDMWVMDLLGSSDLPTGV